MTRWPFLLMATLLLSVDRWSKWWAAETLEFGVPHPLVGEIIRLTRVHNDGEAFGIFPGGGIVFLVVSGVVSFFLLLILLTMQIDSRRLLAGMSLVLAGALGNLVDRLAWGHVLDFFEIRGFPVFNVADACITVGAGLILLSILWGGDRHRSERKTHRV
jgi:signal peptidase II